MEYCVEFMVGLSLLIIGISFIMRQAEWTLLIEHLESKGNRGMLSVGVLHLLFGSFIVGFHWLWEGMALFVTALGIIFIVRGFICLVYPRWAMAKLRLLMKHAKTNLKIGALSAIILSGLILHNWWVMQFGWQYGIPAQLGYEADYSTDVYDDTAVDNSENYQTGE